MQAGSKVLRRTNELNRESLGQAANDFFDSFWAIPSLLYLIGSLLVHVHPVQHKSYTILESSAIKEATMTLYRFGSPERWCLPKFFVQ